jgi:hypothetical protein
VGAGGLLAESVLSPGLARAARRRPVKPSGKTSISPGEQWIGNKRADYALFIEQADAQHPRTQDAVWQGRQCIAFWVYNEDLGPHANPPGDDKNPRTQAQSSTFMKRGGHYIVDHYMYIKRNNFPIWQSGGWMNLWEKYGKPYAGSPALGWSTHDGENWGFVRGEPPWDTLYECPIRLDSWEKVTFEFVNTDPGPVKVSLNGKMVFYDAAFRNINESDEDGNWMTVPHLYMERDGVVLDGVEIGPVWMYDEVRQLA